MPGVWVSLSVVTDLVLSLTGYPHLLYVSFEDTPQKNVDTDQCIVPHLPYITSVQVAPICQRGGLTAGSTTASTTTETTTKRPECPDGWETYTGTGSLVKCFNYGYGGTQYATDAEENCQAHGGHLASIHSVEEQDFLKHTFNPSERVWIGAVDPNQNGGWEWTDGSSFDFSNWSSGQPNGGSGSYYTVMDCSASSSCQWNDLFYGNNYNYICQLTI